MSVVRIIFFIRLEILRLEIFVDDEKLHLGFDYRRRSKFFESLIQYKTTLGYIVKRFLFWNTGMIRTQFLLNDMLLQLF